MASSFQTGMQMGLSAMQMANQNRIQQAELEMAQAREARAAEEFGWKRDQQNREDAAFTNFNNMTAGVDKDAQGKIQQTYGMSPSQVSQAIQNGGAAGLRSQLASYDAPDSYDLQNVPEAPAGGVQPGRFTAAQLPTKEPSRMDMERAMMGLAISRRDMQGMRQSQANMAELQKSEIASKVMNMKTSDLEALAPDINMSGYPMLYTGKGKGGYTFLKTEADGKTPIPGSTFTLNESQLRQLAMSHELGSAGFGTEALATLTAAHKDIGEHVAKWNDVQVKAQQANTQSLHAANTDFTNATNAKTMSDLRTEQIRGLRETRENKEASLALMEKWDALTPEQQNGAEGDALIKQYNMLNVKAGGIVPLQGKGGGKGKGGILSMPVEQKKNDDGTYTAFAKDGGRALYNTLNGEEIPLGMSSDEYLATKKAARDNGVKLVTGEENGRLVLKYQGVDGQYYDDVEKARYAKPAKTGGLNTSGAGTANTVNTEPEKKYVRSKSVRGGYTYTESPRGLTRSQYAEIDAQK